MLFFKCRCVCLNPHACVCVFDACVLACTVKLLIRVSRYRINQLHNTPIFPPPPPTSPPPPLPHSQSSPTEQPVSSARCISLRNSTDSENTSSPVEKTGMNTQWRVYTRACTCMYIKRAPCCNVHCICAVR